MTLLFILRSRIFLNYVRNRCDRIALAYEMAYCGEMVALAAVEACLVDTVLGHDASASDRAEARSVAGVHHEEVAA